MDQEKEIPLQIKEAFCVFHGWEKKKGFKVKMEMLDSDCEEIYFPEEDRKEVLEEGIEFWCQKDNPEHHCYDSDEIDGLIEEIEDNDEDDNIFDKFVKSYLLQND